LDIDRSDRARDKRRKRALYLSGVVLAVIVVSLGLAQLEPAAPSVDSNSLYISTVKRGEMLRQVRGPGTLVPENLQWIAAASNGRVERVLVLPGTEVSAETVILELSNPELAQEALDAETGLRAAESDLEVLRAQLDSQILMQESSLAQVDSQFKQAQLQLEADQRLFQEGLLPELELNQSRLAIEHLERRLDLETQRLERNRHSAASQLEARRSRLSQMLALHELRQDQLQALRVEAGMAGVLQEVQVEEGQRITAGATLARVAQPGNLKAELRIPETQARDLQNGLVASIDTRNGVIEGRISRVDPAVREGSVTVDVALVGELPKGARPDLSVDGTIEIERLEDVLFVGRPAYGQAHQTVSLFRLEDGSETAHRIQVQLGRTSVSTIEVLAGLEEGDRVILSDTSTWDDYDRLKLK
jgi:HlyD family secretion protein